MPSYPRSDAVSYQQSAPWTRAFESDADDNTIYAGRANPESCLEIVNAGQDPKVHAIWQIQKFAWDVNGNCTDIRWAEGNDRFEHVWNDRASITFA